MSSLTNYKLFGDTSQVVRATVCPLPGALAFLTVLSLEVKTLVWTDNYLDLCEQCDTIHPETEHARTHARTHARLNQTASIASCCVMTECVHWFIHQQVITDSTTAHLYTALRLELVRAYQAAGNYSLCESVRL